MLTSVLTNEIAKIIKVLYVQRINKIKGIQ